MHAHVQYILVTAALEHADHVVPPLGGTVGVLRVGRGCVEAVQGRFEAQPNNIATTSATAAGRALAVTGGQRFQACH